MPGAPAVGSSSRPANAVAVGRDSETAVPAAGDEAARLREALLDLCLEQGFAAVTLPALLDRAGLDRAAFDRHHPDLEDLFCTVYLEIREDFFARLQVALAAESGWRDRLRAAAYAFLRFLRADRRVTHLAVVDVRLAGGRAQVLFGEAFARLLALLDEGRAERADPGSLSPATAEGVAAAIFGRIQEAVAARSPDLRDEAVPGLMYAAVLPYLGAEAAAEELTISPPR